MPTFSPKCMAHDAARGVTYLTATYGKMKYVLSVDGAMQLEVVRTHAAPPDNAFWVHDGTLVFWSLGKTIALPLADPAAKAKTHKLATATTSYNLHAAFERPHGSCAVLDTSVHRFDGERWVPIDSTMTSEDRVVRTTLRGAYVRPIGGGLDAWRPLVEGQAVRATVSISGERALISGFGTGAVVIGLDGSDPRPVAKGNWCSVGYEGGFFAWADRKVLAIGFDGSIRDTERTTNHEEAADRCLFRCGESVYFVQRNFVHRYRDGAWTRHDLADEAGGIGLT